ncbi:MAG: MobF family relaxase [Rhodoferax sp.]|nr:MobF family relaxase [Rhodoferax sp.]
MTVSHKKTSPAGGQYYIDGLEEEGLHDSDDPHGLTALWWIVGPGSVAAEVALGIDSGRRFTAADLPKFEALVQGFHPSELQRKRRLVQNAGNPRRVALHDFTLSAPKSVSVVWSQADERTKRLIEAAQGRAARAFVSLVGSRAAYSRQGKAGILKTPCAIVAALFAHGTSRAEDPQLHTHCTLLNVTIRSDGSSGALETRKIMCWQGAAACLYHAELAFGLRELGFGIEQAGNLFEVEGVPAEVCVAFSQRRRAVLAAATSELLRRGRDPEQTPPSRGLLRKVVIQTRAPKVMRPRSELEHSWLQRGEAMGFGPNQVRELMHGGNARVADRHEMLTIARSVAAELDQDLNEFTEPTLVARVAVALAGRADAVGILKAIDAVIDELAQRDRDGLAIGTSLLPVDREKNSLAPRSDDCQKPQPGTGNGGVRAAEGSGQDTLGMGRAMERMRE